MATSLITKDFERFQTLLRVTVEDSSSYVRVGSFTLSKGFWVVSVRTEWASGKPYGLHIAENDVTTDTPKWSNENDVGGQEITFCTMPDSNINTFTVFTLGGWDKMVRVFAYKLL